MIELTKQEVQGIIKDLAEIPAKYSFNLISFLSKKLQNAEKSEEPPMEESTPTE